MQTTTTKAIPSVPSKNPFIGFAKELRADTTGTMYKYMREYGDVYRMPIIPFIKLLVVSSPTIAEHILVKNNRNYVKSVEYKAMKKVLGNGLVTSEGDFWRRQRRLAQPAFHRKRIANFADTMVNCIEATLLKLEKKTNQVIDIHEFMMELTMDIVSRTVFGLGENDLDYDRKVISEAVGIGNQHIDKLIHYPFFWTDKIPTRSNKAYWKADADLQKLIYGIIQKRRASNQNKDDLLGMLLEARDEETGKGMSEQQLYDELLTMFVAGHETTAVALTWLWYILKDEPESLAKLQEEVDTVLGDRLPTLEDLPNLTYTKMVIQETMRLYPPAWTVGRKPLEDDTITDVTLPKGSNITIFVYGIHRNPNYWKNPQQFIPERFTKEAIAARPKYAYMPFGGGPRLCIGNSFAMMEMQLAVAMIAQRFQFKYASDKAVGTDAFVTLRPKSEVWMTVQKRG